jgi:hypothetical protein
VALGGAPELKLFWVSEFRVTSCWSALEAVRVQERQRLGHRNIGLRIQEAEKSVVKVQGMVDQLAGENKVLAVSATGKVAAEFVSLRVSSPAKNISPSSASDGSLTDRREVFCITFGHSDHITLRCF